MQFEMPRPTPHHETLRALAGTWTGDERLHPSPWDPKGGSATGHVEARMALRDMFLVMDYRQVRDEETWKPFLESTWTRL